MKKVQSIEELVGSVLKGLVKKGRPTEEDIAAAWEAAVGKNAARHTNPVALKRSVLVVIVDVSAWLYELSTKKKDILVKLEEVLGARKVKDIRFRIGAVKTRGENG